MEERLAKRDTAFEELECEKDTVGAWSTMLIARNSNDVEELQSKLQARETAQLSKIRCV